MARIRTTEELAHRAWGLECLHPPAHGVWRFPEEIRVPPPAAFGRFKAPTWVYRMFTRNLDLAYVGITDRPRDRLCAHARKPWWSSVVFIYWEPCETRQDALDEEALALVFEDPEHNIQFPGEERRKQMAEV